MGPRARPCLHLRADTVDSRSPDYAATKQVLAGQLEDLDLEAELVKFDFMDHDDEFAVVRVKTKTSGTPGAGFTDNVVDAIVLFRQENGARTIWSEEIVAVDILP